MMDYYTCNSFFKSFEIKDKFSLFQKQLVVAGNFKLRPANVEYKCEWYPSQIDPKKPFVAIPIRNCSPLLRYTLENFSKNKMFDLTNVIIVDDRSNEDLTIVTRDYPVSLLKGHHDFKFNCSMINTIAALVSHH